MPKLEVITVCDNIEKFPKHFTSKSVRPAFAKKFKQLYNQTVTNDNKAEDEAVALLNNKKALMTTR